MKMQSTIIESNNYVFVFIVAKIGVIFSRYVSCVRNHLNGLLIDLLCQNLWLKLINDKYRPPSTPLLTILIVYRIFNKLSNN